MPVKTTVNLDEELLRLARQAAVDQGVTLRHVLEEALRAAVLRAPRQGGFKLRWTPITGTGPPLVDISDRDALVEFMEGRH
ncbi:MAG: DUF2191 domain-containing protein [Chloroflexi bacterium]|nr:DUF2191 domain-containing protein [Chloroflexota bacterium]